MNPILFDGVIKTLFVFILVNSALIITERHFRSLFTTYSVQSLSIALLAVILFIQHWESTFLFLAIVTVISKVIIIPRFMKRVHKNMKIQRDVEFYMLTPISSMFTSLFLVIIAYQLVSKFPAEFLPTNTHRAGVILGLSLVFIGMLILFSRKQAITKIMGYLTMENGVLLFSLFFPELPFIVEILIILDLVMLIMLVTILAFGINSTMDLFYKKLNPLQKWFGEDNE